MQDEIWGGLKDFPLYEISTLGRIRSNYKQQPKYLKKQIANGYESIKLYYKGKSYFRYIHRLVAETFLPNPDRLPQVNHKNENKLDNSLSNIEWCDAYYNTHYGSRNYRIGLSGAGTKKPQHMVFQFTLDNELVNTFKNASAAEKSTHIHHSYILKCCKGLSKTAGGYKWNYGQEVASA